MSITGYPTYHSVLTCLKSRGPVATGSYTAADSSTEFPEGCDRVPARGVLEDNTLGSDGRPVFVEHDYLLTVCGGSLLEYEFRLWFTVA